MLSRFFLFLLLSLPFVLVPARLEAAEQKATRNEHPLVPGFERFYSAAAADAAQGGRLLLGELNCTACHKPSLPLPSPNGQRTEWELPRKQAPILDGVGSRLRRSFLRRFLRAPQAVKPGTTMPNLFAALPEAERDEKVEALVHFLASTGSLQQERLDPQAVPGGKQLYHQVGCVACHGSRDDKGQAAKRSPTSVPLGDLPGKYSPASLAAFLEDPLALRPSGRMPGLLNKQEARQVAHYLLQAQSIDSSEAFPLQPALVEKGRELFASVGCADCHHLNRDGKVIVSLGKAPALKELRGAGGCLAERPVKGLPWYSLSAAQRRALAAALRSPAAIKPTPEEIITRTMMALNCYACHQRGKLGGVEEGVNAFFVTTQPEMGEEGRLPPPLHDTGAKLRADYLQHIFNQGAHDRPYMLTRMPRFGATNLPGLIEALAAADGHVKTAILMLKRQLSRESAELLLDATHGYLRNALHEPIDK